MKERLKMLLLKSKMAKKLGSIASRALAYEWLNGGKKENPRARRPATARLAEERSEPL